jgi:hypothetical protein
MILLGDPRGLMHTFDVPKIINKCLSFLHNKHVRQRDWLASVRSGPSGRFSPEVREQHNLASHGLRDVPLQRL